MLPDANPTAIVAVPAPTVELELWQLPIISHPVAEAIKEFHLEHRLDVDKALNSCHALIEQKKGAVLVDNVVYPGGVVVLSLGDSIIFHEKFCVAMLLYTLREKRSIPLAIQMGKGIEDYARQHGCNVIYGSEWVYRGATGIGALWKRLGYEEQEHVYTKHL